MLLYLQLYKTGVLTVYDTAIEGIYGVFTGVKNPQMAAIFRSMLTKC